MHTAWASLQLRVGTPTVTSPERESATGTYRTREIVAAVKDTPVHIAALRFPDEQEDAVVPCVVVTVAPSEEMARVHHRQPLCLSDDEVAVWLDPRARRRHIEGIVAAGAERNPHARVLRFAA